MNQPQSNNVQMLPRCLTVFFRSRIYRLARIRITLSGPTYYYTRLYSLRLQDGKFNIITLFYC